MNSLRLANKTEFMNLSSIYLIGLFFRFNILKENTFKVPIWLK